MPVYTISYYDVLYMISYCKLRQDILVLLVVQTKIS